ncbi:MAG TPA: hypothetical protein VGM90_33675 [Kofleriaceae bacterium]|jgi:tetratricopeptide (TPR) repeat protein
MTMQCPSELALDQAFNEGPTPELLVHLESCVSCSRIWDETEEAISIAHALPAYVPTGARLEELRTALLAAPAAPPAPAPSLARRRMSWIVPAATIAMAAGIVLVLNAMTDDAPRAPAPPSSPRHAHGLVHAHAGALYSIVGLPPDELVRLRDGVADFDVDPLGPGERFRVIVGTDEVEVRGTSFEIVAVNDRLRNVHVVHGRVDVRIHGGPTTTLNAGESWEPTTTAVAAPPPPPVVTTPATRVSRPPKPRPPVMPPTTKPQEVEFTRGWEHMRQGDLSDAAVAFGRAVALDPSGALAEDASFWRAIAIARLDRTYEAITALREFLATYQNSTRSGEASATLGWLLVDIGELTEARARFRTAEQDTNAAVQMSARKGLDELNSKKE